MSDCRLAVSLIASDDVWPFHFMTEATLQFEMITRKLF